eukprot:gene19936-23688_t
MKLVEAAAILGISLEDVTTDSLKQQYRRLIMSWDPDTVRDIQAKAKYSQVTEAYKRLSSVMEGKDSVRPEDQHDVAAFMRIFMDMMGMSSEHDIPHAAAMTFSMMFGNHQNGTDEYSTDEDADGNYYDDDEDEEDDEEDYDADASLELRFAVCRGQSGRVEALLKKKANLLQEDRHGWNCVHWAASRGYVDVMEVLLEHHKRRGKRLRPLLLRRDGKLAGWTPLHIAAVCGHLDVA